MSGLDYLVMVLVGLLSAVLGGIVTAWMVASYLRGHGADLIQSHVVQVDVQLQAGPVRIPVSVQQPGPYKIPVEVDLRPTPDLAERARWVLGEWPDAGPSALARAIGCSKSTAAGLLADLRAGAQAQPGPGNNGKGA